MPSRDERAAAGFSFTEPSTVELLAGAAALSIALWAAIAMTLGT